jgi:hypothetical protein
MNKTPPIINLQNQKNIQTYAGANGRGDKGNLKFNSCQNFAATYKE